MMFGDLGDIILNPTFLIMFSLVLAAFLPLLFSIWTTWLENDDASEWETWE